MRTDPFTVATKLNELLQEFCFSAGTQVATADGNKSIEEIQAGDWVWTQSDRTGDIMLKPVKLVLVNIAASLVVLHCGTNSIEATPEHPIWVADQGWKAADQIKPGDELWEQTGKRLAVTSIDHKQGRFTVFNLEIEDTHTYFVSELQVLVHNNCEWSSKVLAQIRKAQLPEIGELPFIPKLIKNKAGEQIVEKAEVLFGPRACH